MSQQQDFRRRVTELLRRTEQLHEAVKNFAETMDIDDSDVYVTAGTSTSAAENNTHVVAVPEHGDALAPDYATNTAYDYEDSFDKEPSREQVEEAYDAVHDAKEDVNALVESIDIDALLDSVPSDIQL